MTETTAIWTVLGLLVTVLGFFARYFINKIDELAAGRAESELGEFKSMDVAREKGWASWREERVEYALNDHETRLRSHTAEISRILGRMNGNHK